MELLSLLHTDLILNDGGRPLLAAAGLFLVYFLVKNSWWHSLN